MIQEIGRFILDHDHFLISSHSRPDGDSIGTQLALAEGLEQLGKSAEIANRDPYPPNYRVLPGIEKIHLENPSSNSYDGLIVLECNNLERTGVEGLPDTFVVNIDHHPSNDQFGDLNWVDPSASAVAELIYELLVHLGVKITPEIATNLYVAILTDTGSFQFSNTSHRTFQIVSELVKAGASPSEIAQMILQRQSRSRIRLLGVLLHSMEFNTEGTIAWISLLKSTIKEIGASPEDTEGLVNYPLSVEGVELSAFFREERHDTFRISLRSKGDLDVGSVAEEFGGGGHRNAAGLTLTGSYVEVMHQVVNRLESLLSAIH
jgi:phosphoesterase RecJ-like protein